MRRVGGGVRKGLTDPVRSAASPVDPQSQDKEEAMQQKMVQTERGGEPVSLSLSLSPKVFGIVNSI